MRDVTINFQKYPYSQYLINYKPVFPVSSSSNIFSVSVFSLNTLPKPFLNAPQDGRRMSKNVNGVWKSMTLQSGF
jgi:hypothetical protein